MSVLTLCAKFSNTLKNWEAIIPIFRRAYGFILEKPTAFSYNWRSLHKLRTRDFSSKRGSLGPNVKLKTQFLPERSQRIETGESSWVKSVI